MAEKPARFLDDGSAPTGPASRQEPAAAQHPRRAVLEPSGEQSEASSLLSDHLGADPDPDARHSARHARPEHHWLRTAFVLMISLAVLGGGALFVYLRGADLFRSWTGAEDFTGTGTAGTVVVTIPSGAGSTEMGTILQEAGVVASVKAFTRAARADDATFRRIQAGNIRLNLQQSAASALAAMALPANQVRAQFTVLEGLRTSEVLAAISQQTGVSSAELESAAGQPALIGLPDYAEGDPEGFLFPETYAFSPAMKAADLLKLTTTQFTKVSGQLGLEAGAARLGRTPREVVIVASLIEREVNDDRYRADVAQVIYNRLDRGMLLQLDSTVHFANNISGTVTTTDAQRAIDSPYNTYRYAGLPPGPIANPGTAALTAALNPTTGSYLYFVAVNPGTGETRFASDAAGHQENVRLFQAWCQANPGRC